MHDSRPKVAELAKEIYAMHFPYAEQNKRKKQLVKASGVWGGYYMIDSLSNRTGTPVKWGKSSETQGTEKTAKSAMSDGFIERIKAYAKEDAKWGEYTFVSRFILPQMS